MSQKKPNKHTVQWVSFFILWLWHLDLTLTGFWRCPEETSSWPHVCLFSLLFPSIPFSPSWRFERSNATMFPPTFSTQSPCMETHYPSLLPLSTEAISSPQASKLKYIAVFSKEPFLVLTCPANVLRVHSYFYHGTCNSMLQLIFPCLLFLTT